MRNLLRWYRQRLWVVGIECYIVGAVLAVLCTGHYQVVKSSEMGWATFAMFISGFIVWVLAIGQAFGEMYQILGVSPPKDG